MIKNLDNLNRAIIRAEPSRVEPYLGYTSSNSGCRAGQKYYTSCI